MKTEKTELNKRMRQFETICHDAGVKLTHQRLEIFREVAKTGDHPDAETVQRRVHKRLPTVSLDTVYRTLWLLKDIGLITTLGSNHHRARFDANLHQHHHFVCTRCGLTQDFSSRELDELRLPDVLGDFGLVEAANVEVRGVCHKCSSMQKKKRSSDQPVKGGF